MALQSSFYNTDGTTRTYPSTKHIATKQHVSVYGKRVSDSTWVILAVDLYELVNNSIVFDTAPDIVIYSQIEVRVADTAIELEDSPSDIAIVAGIAANVSTVAGNTTNINTVATNIGAVQTVSANDANVTTVATNIANVNTVAGNTTNINTVAGISGNVTTVAGISANVTTVAGNTANINTVATDISAVTTVANDLNEPVSEIETVAGSIANVNTVGTAIANVNTVAGSITNVNTVGASMANVNSVATTVVPNIAEILLADDNAATATAKALEAQHWANYTTDAPVPEGTGEFSAKHYSVKASEYAASVNPSNIMHLTGNESASGVKTFTDGINAPQLVGFKNYIINGNFDVWQRGSSFTGLTNGSYSADRWVVYDTTGDINYNVIRHAGTFTGGYGASYTWNSGTGRRDIIQFIENITKFKVGSSVTVSFEAYTNSTPYSITVSIQGVRGAWASVTAEVTTSTISLANTKTKYSVTLSVPNWSSIGIDWAHLEDTKLALKFNFGADTNGKDFIISNVQLEEGSVATPFEQRPYGLELSLCQRYFRMLSGAVGRIDTTNTNAVFGVDMSANNMRISPTVSFAGTSQIHEMSIAVRSISSILDNGISIKGGYIRFAMTTSGSSGNLCNIVGNVYLSSEL